MGKQLGEGAVFAIRRSAAALFVTLCLATPALGAAGDPLPPWDGDSARVTPLEARSSRIARSLAGPDVSIECVRPATWRSLAAEYGFETLYVTDLNLFLVVIGLSLGLGLLSGLLPARQATSVDPVEILREA